MILDSPPVAEPEIACRPLSRDHYAKRRDVQKRTSMPKSAMSVAWHLGVRLRDFSRRLAFWLETEAGPSLKLPVNLRLDLRIPIRARHRLR
jgi:hypothetical protein